MNSSDWSYDSQLFGNRYTQNLRKCGCVTQWRLVFQTFPPISSLVESGGLNNNLFPCIFIHFRRKWTGLASKSYILLRLWDFLCIMYSFAWMTLLHNFRKSATFVKSYNPIREHVCMQYYCLPFPYYLVQPKGGGRVLKWAQFVCRIFLDGEGGQLPVLCWLVGAPSICHQRHLAKNGHEDQRL